MAANSIIPFAQAGGANVQSDATYAAASDRTNGNQPGIASSALNNKALRQASAIAVGVAQFLADKQSVDVTDALLGSAISAMLQDAIRASALGYAGMATIAGTATLTAADLGKMFQLSGSSFTVTLPAASACPPGTALHFGASSLSGTVSIVRAGTDTIGHGSGFNAQTSVAMRNGDGLTLVSNGGGAWIAASKTNALPGSIATPGWMQLPCGIIIQWGTVTGVNSTTAITTSFPITYPSLCYTLTSTQVSPGVAGATQRIVEAEIISAAQFKLYGNTTANACYWQSIGS